MLLLVLHLDLFLRLARLLLAEPGLLLLAGVELLVLNHVRLASLEVARMEIVLDRVLIRH